VPQFPFIYYDFKGVKKKAKWKMIDFDTSISDFVVYYAVISFVFLFHCVIKDYDFPKKEYSLLYQNMPKNYKDVWTN